MFPARLPLLLCVGFLMAVPSSPLLAGQQKTAVRAHAGTSPSRSVKSLASVCNDSTRLSDPTFAKNQAYLFAWTAFLAINCPAQINVGLAAHMGNLEVCRRCVSARREGSGSLVGAPAPPCPSRPAGDRQLYASGQE